MIPAELLVQATGGKPRSIPILKAAFTIGRGKGCDLRIHDQFASEDHCRIAFDQGGFTVTDLKSKNGTLLNNEPITQSDLRWGDVIKIGETSMVFMAYEKEQEPEVLIEDSPPEGETTHATVSLTRKVDVPEPQKQEPVRPNDFLRAYKSLALIHTLVSTINNTSVLSEMLKLVLELIVGSTKANRGKMILLGSQYEEELVAELPVSGKIHLEPRILKTVVDGREAVLLRSRTGQDREYTSICSPLVSRRGVLGVLYVDTAGNKVLFDAQDLELIGTLSSILGTTIENVRTAQKVRQENVELKQALYGRQDILGESSAIRSIFQLIGKFASTESTILITGESGSGKELVAKAIHFQSARKNAPLVVVNCAAIPNSLLESELFGYEKGAFTGAYKTKIGRFEEAHQGTLFLDEIGDLDQESQVKILRAIEQKSIQRIGGTKVIPTDIRIIAATNRDLKEAIRKGSFREDLYFRLKVLEIHVPPLRERREDIPLLAQAFLKESSAALGKKLSFDPEATKFLAGYSWPGNVRELKNAIERAAVLCDRSLMTIQDFTFLKSTPAAQPLRPLAEMEKNHITAVLSSVRGNKSRAAEILGITRSTLYEKLKGYGLDAGE